MITIRRARRRELVGLTPEQIEEWREQMAEVREEQYASDWLRLVSPDEWY